MLGLGSKGKWLEIEIFELRAGGNIRIVDDKVQRRKESDNSQYYYLKKEKEELSTQEFEDIFVGAKGQQKLKCFSPVKGVYWPIKFFVKKIRNLTDSEKKEIEAITDPELKKLKEKEIYQKIYETYLETVIDTETLNHAIYKMQKNQLRLQTGKGISPTVILVTLIITIAVFIVLASWSEYNYFMKPAMEFWNSQAPIILEASQRVSCPNPIATPPQPVPVG
jgi:hypothetical protein